MKCSKCKNELIEYRNGDSVEHICPICDEMPVTQYENLIEFDSNKYTVKILVTKDYDKSMLKGVATICSCNMLEAKKILEETGMEFKPYDALETRALKRKIEEIGVSYVVTPEFNW